MLRIMMERLRQRGRTIAFPGKDPPLPERFRGLPAIDGRGCSAGCGECFEVCPTGAITAPEGRLSLDMGKCIFCPECEKACGSGAVAFSREFRLASRRREGLLIGGISSCPESAVREIPGSFRRSLRLRQVSAGGCNACESDVGVLQTVVFDAGRFGIEFVASPRHADGILVTGPVSDNMRLALLKTWEAVPSPKLVIASGACAISGGPYIGHAEVSRGLSEILPVDLFVPGCPPHPLTLLEGLLRLQGRST